MSTSLDFAWPFSFSSCVLLTIGILVLRFLIICVYRLTYHPLAKFPGPFFAKITDWHAAYHAYRGDMHLCMYAAHQKYGDMVRFGPNRVLSNTCAGLHDIYHSKNVKKSKGYLTILPKAGAYSVHTAIDKNVHRRKRMVISQGLSYDVLRIFEPLMLVHVRKFCQKLLSDTDDGGAGGWTTPKNVTDYCNYLTFDVMGEFGFGRDFQMQDQPDNRYLINAIAASNVRTSIYGHFPELAKFKLEKILYPKGYLMRQKFLNLTREFAESRVLAGKDAKNDLFSFVIGAKDPETGEGFSLDELWSESKFLIVAGSDTSSTVLASTFFYLTRYPACYERVTQEVRSSFTSIDEIRSSSNLTECTYLRACIYESMRISPPAGGSLWRESEGVDVDGFFIPAGLDVGTSIYAIHHNEAYFPDPFTYNPERWIPSPTVTKESIEMAHRALNPFSLGPRGCVGRGLAYMELSDTLAMVIWLMDFRRPEGALGLIGEGTPGAKGGRHRVNEFQLEDHLTSVKDGPFVEFRRRKI